MGFGCVCQVDGVAFVALCVGLGCCGVEVRGPGDVVVKEYIVGSGLVSLALAFEEACSILHLNVLPCTVGCVVMVVCGCVSGGSAAKAGRME